MESKTKSKSRKQVNMRSLAK